MHLKNHLALYSFVVESLIDANHSQFDDVCRTTLYGCVDGIALCITTNGGILTIDVGKIATTMHKGFYITVLLCGFFTLLHVGLNLWEGAEIAVDELFGFAAFDVQTLCQSKNSDAIYNTKVGTFGLGALVSCHLVDRLFIDLCSGGSVNVVPFYKGFDHVFIAT